AIQPERHPGNPAKQEVKTVDRQAADEDAEANRGGLAPSASAFCAQAHERTPKLNRDAAHFAPLTWYSPSGGPCESGYSRTLRRNERAVGKRDAARRDQHAIGGHRAFDLVQPAHASRDAGARFERHAGSGRRRKLERAE